MSQHSNSKPKPPQSKMNKSSHSKKPTSRLKLVVSNPAPFQGALPPSQLLASNAGFTAKVKKRGSDLYEMDIQDPFHDLGCNLILETEKSGSDTTVVCHFPVILNESNKFLDEDETLYGTITIQFQMKVLEQLFLFCVDHNASQLIIYMDDEHAEGFGIYQDLLIHCDETLTENGEKTEMVISINQKTFDKWRSFMAEVNLKFEQDLWREQRFNPIIRRYLKSRSRG